MSMSSTTHWRPGARVARLKASHGYGAVLVLVVVTFFYAASAPDEQWSRGVFVLLETATLTLAVWTSGLSRDVRLGGLIGVVGIAGLTLSLLGSKSDYIGTVWIVNVLLVGATILTIGLGIVDQGEVNQQSITGAVCVYVLLGLMFAFAYGAIAAIQSGPFFAQGTDGTSSLRVYFSYVTLATLGYGDYTPASNLGHTIAVVEALLGQIYLVTVVALLVGNLSGMTKKIKAEVTSPDDPA
jgi:Ion channel